MEQKKTAKKSSSKIWFGLAVFGIVLAGLVPRLIYLGELRQKPGYLAPGIDGAYHFYWARGLSTGVWEVTEGRDNPEVWLYPFYRPPGYPYLLGLIFYLTDVSSLAPRLIQMFLGLVTALLVGKLGKDWFGSGTGFLAGLWCATYWIFIYYEGELLGVSVAALLGPLLLMSLARAGYSGSRFFIFSSGLLLGVYALFRPNILLFAPVALVWLLGISRRFLKLAGIFILGVIIPLVPVTARNFAVSKELVPICTNLGISIGVANNPEAEGTTHSIPGLGLIGTPFDWPRIVRDMEQARGFSPGELSHRKASGILTSQALAWITAHPGDFIRLLGKKALYFWGPREVRNIRELELERVHSSILSLLPLTWSLTAGLGLVGLIMILGNRHQGSWPRRYGCLMGLFILIYFISIWPFAVAARYRVPVIPILILPAAFVVIKLIEFTCRKKWTRLIVWGSAGLLAWGLFSLDLTGYEISPEKWHNDRGLSYFSQGEYTAAALEFQEALLVAPGYADAMTNLGASLRKLSDYNGAINSYRQALRFKNSPRTHRNLAEVLVLTGRIKEALDEYQAALDLAPGYVKIRLEYARALEKTGAWGKAADQYQQALQVYSSDPGIHLALGVALGKLGKYEAACAHFKEVLRLEPSSPEAVHNLEEIAKIRSGEGAQP